MALRFRTHLTGRNLPKIQQRQDDEPSIINDKTIEDFARVVDQTGILKPDVAPQDPRDGD
jgi:hypothetical protein